MTFSKNPITILLLTLIFVTSCNKDDAKEITADFFVALPTPPVKVKNTDGTWMVYELHIKAPALQKVDIFNDNNLQLSYSDFNTRGDINIGSIWFPFPEQGWQNTELVHKFQYKDAAGNSKEYIFNLTIQQQYPDPITIAFPLPPGVWLAESSASSTSLHTRALFPFPDGPKFDSEQEGYIFGNNPQRYAIDYIKFVDGLPYKNDGSNLEDWYCYNSPILAAQGGIVIFTEDGIPDHQTPFELDYPTDATNATGNVVYIEHADGTIGTYCHLIPNSVLVEKGDIVITGQELGRLGNSGNSLLPHLHMHVLTNPEGKQINEYADGLFMESLPYKFSQFTKLGALPIEYLDHPPLTPFTATMSEVYNNVLPSESDIIEF